MTDFQADHSLELECERKWLISKKIPYDLNSIKSVKIQQRYFKNTENKTQRIRLIDDKTYILNRKVFQKGVLGAVEMEKKITKKEAEELLKHAIPNQMG
jgi:CYTH domain-containing protein